MGIVWNLSVLRSHCQILDCIFVFSVLNLKASLIISAMAFVASECFQSILYKHGDLLNRGNLPGPSLINPQRGISQNGLMKVEEVMLEGKDEEA